MPSRHDSSNDDSAFTLWRILVSLLVALGCVSATVASRPLAAQDEYSQQQIDFFEARIRPVLVEHCYECHSAESSSMEGELRLDTRELTRRGGATGPAIVPGKPDESLLLEAIRYASLEMPPTGRLSERVIADFETWISQGAADPRTASEADNTHDDAADPDWAQVAKDHWAFHPVVKPDVPKQTTSTWGSNEIDAFIWQKLNESGLQPTIRASRRTLIRRVYFDLLGLPPSPEEVDAFVSDDSPHAYRELVDELLESPHYGERWARHWLDVARYADNRGYAFYFENTYPWAWTYRDWVVQALNDDMPFDQFVRQQIAADLLEPSDDAHALAAMGFLTVGDRFINNAHDVIDDRIDVVTRGLMGVTVTCARCHDHKFDPIPQADYYSLYGMFRSSYEPLVLPVLGVPEESDDPSEFDIGLEERLGKLNQFVEEQRDRVSREARERAHEYLLAVHRARGHPVTDEFMLLTEQGELIPLVVQRWQRYLKRTKLEHDPIWSVWHAFSQLSDESFAAEAPKVHEALFAPQALSQRPIHPHVLASFESSPPENMDDVAGRYAGILLDVDHQWQRVVSETDATGSALPNGLDDPDQESMRQVLYGVESPPSIPNDLDGGFLQLLPDRPNQEEFKKLLKEVEQWTMTRPDAPARAMVLYDRVEPFEPFVFVRGNPNRQGEAVPRRVPGLIADLHGESVERGSGRLELANAIVAPTNPLTARVIVNRVWQHHFGEGLVRTPSDFGVRSLPPSHPELLDWLAATLVEDGWSIKGLHRRIMNSDAYQQASTPRVDSEDEASFAESLRATPLRADPQNRLLSYFPRRRLDYESIRDALLAVSGELDRSLGGPTVDLNSGTSNRRTLYGFIDRLDLPVTRRTFDFPSPNATSPGREETTVPPQALFFLNGDFVQRCAESLVRRDDVVTLTDTKGRIDRIYHLLFGRSPEEWEFALSMSFVEREVEIESTNESKYGYGSVDESTGRVATFVEFGYWTNGQWQVGPQLPDPQVGWAFMTRLGGHPAASDERCSIRRWTASEKSRIAISGRLIHRAEPGNGVRGRIVSSREGILGEWVVDESSEDCEPIQTVVEPGDTIDFVVDYRGHIIHDEFEWPVSIRFLADDDTYIREWKSEDDFVGPESDVWVDFVQALMMANEFIFID